MCTIGFILLTHNKPRQLHRLIQTLDREFDRPPIAVHHDFDKCPLDVEAFGDNVRFVRPHVPTGWAAFSVVEGTVKAMQLLLDWPQPPQWFVILSGADYPIKPGCHIRRQMAQSTADALMSCMPVTRSSEQPYIRSCVKRWLDRHSEKTRLGRAVLRAGRILPAIRKLPGIATPYDRGLACHAGSQWFSLRREAADYIVRWHQQDHVLGPYLRGRKYSEETYFQTILANAGRFRISGNNHRFIEFSEHQAHPNTLGVADVPRLLDSPHHFARKFDYEDNPTVADAIDRALAEWHAPAASEASNTATAV